MTPITRERILSKCGSNVRTLFKQLNDGDHAIISFQMDEKRNMLFAKPHKPFDITSKGSGGFLHNENM